MTADKRSSLRVPEADLTTHLVVDRRSRISRWGRGNSKLGPGVYTFDRLPGKGVGTCPGSTEECESICYAKRLAYNEPVWDLLRRNSEKAWIHDENDPLPADARIVRIHVSGDFDKPEYVQAWITLVRERPDVRFFGYTRSWRVPALVEKLTALRDEPNVQLFASVDRSSELPPEGWRIAWIDGDPRLREYAAYGPSLRYRVMTEGVARTSVTLTPVCPEETGRKANCESCRYCIDGKRGDIVFLQH